MSKTKDKLTDVVYEYLYKQNRPYSIIDIFNNLHKEHGKTAIIKAIEKLVEEGKIIEKTYGKQKIFYPEQSLFPTANEDELRKMEAEIKNLSATIEEITKVVKLQETTLNSLKNSLSDEELKKRVILLTEKEKHLQSKLQALKSTPTQIDPKEKLTILKSHENLSKEWRKRKRIANDILDSILEGYPKSKKILLEEIGVETDEENNVCPPAK